MAETRPATTPALSVVLPVYNAMPWLPIALRDLLRQRLPDDVGLEVLAVFDGGADGSLGFLRGLVEELGVASASDELCEPPIGTTPSNPALLQPLRASETEDHPSFGAAPELEQQPLSVAAVVATCRPEHRVRLLRYRDGANRGQGAAMSLALSVARAPFVAQMESDDERAPPDAFARMMCALEARPEWDGVSCQVELVGWPRPGMSEYVAWQNSLLSSDEMAAGRFLEIPALHQTALFRRRAVDEVLKAYGGTCGGYRDGPRILPAACGGGSAEGDALDTPVDLWWWLAFFQCGKR